MARRDAAPIPPTPEEAKLLETLRKIEALFSGATTAGEREAADAARGRIRKRLEQVAQEDPPIEYRFSMNDTWNRRVFLALLRRYGLRPYRYAGQRHTTVMVRVSRRFVDETLWPEYQQIARTLFSHLDQITNRLIGEALHHDASDPQEVPEPKRLD
jgi:hypothetical protein